MQLQRLKQDFLAHLELKLGRSDKTIENYDLYLKRFLNFSKVKKPSEITKEQISKFRLYLSRQRGTKVGGKLEPMKQRTQNYHLIAVRSFLKFLNKRGVISVSFEQIELVKVPERSLDLISSVELDKLMATPPLNTLEGKRDRAILELLIRTGLRVSELCNLEIGDIDLRCHEFSFRGKGNKERLIFLTDATLVALKNYLVSRKDTEDALFIRYGKKAHIGEEARISPRTVQRLLKSYAVKAGIKQKVTPQAIRHSLAVDLLVKGTDLKSVQTLLGHTSIGTTQIYKQVKDSQ